MPLSRPARTPVRFDLPDWQEVHPAETLRLQPAGFDQITDAARLQPKPLSSGLHRQEARRANGRPGRCNTPPAHRHEPASAPRRLGMRIALIALKGFER